MSTTYPETRNARSTCAFGVMTAEYAVDPALDEDSTATSRTGVGLRASSFAARLAHPPVRIAALTTKPSRV
jgi:hypothetical protein